MPITKQAKKKMRQDVKKTAHNKMIKNNIKTLVKKMRKNPSPKTLGAVTSVLDKAVKTNFIHANKSSRLKSRLSKLMASNAK